MTKPKHGRNSKSGKPIKPTGISWVSILAALVLFVAWFVAERPDLMMRPQPMDGVLSVHYIDVGQGHCVLIRAPGGNMLIDTGTFDHIDKVTGYLSGHGVRTIDVLVGTHPHADHIGGMAAIIGELGVGTVLLPRVEHTGLAYERMLLAMRERGLRARAPAAGESFSLGDAEFTVLAPNAEEYRNINNYSIVLKMTYGGHSFLFTGDAENLSEREMLESGRDLSADFLQVGHHGSRTSTGEAFLDAVAPSLAFIGVGLGNSYGHPHPTVIERLEERGIEIYRTDRHGDIVVETDGVQFRVITEK